MLHQCLGRRTSSIAELSGEWAAREYSRNQSQKGVDWQFTTNDARINLKRLYPQYIIQTESKKRFLKLKYLKIVVLIFLCFITNISNVHADSQITNYYNPSGQLETAHYSNGNVINYYYDKNGNLLSKLSNKNLINNPSFENIKDDQTVADGWSTWSDTHSADKFEVISTPVSAGTTAQK